MAIRIPQTSGQSLAVDFIDNRMPEYHEAFEDPPTRFDNAMDKYVPKQSLVSSGKRPLPTPSEKMAFWASVFPPAMAQFITKCPAEPKGRLESGQSIRILTSWTDVYALLCESRQGYDNPQGRTGVFKRGFRKVVDNAQPARSAIKFIPDNNYLAPAAKKSSDLRGEVSSELDELERNFDDIESFLLTFPEDDNIRRASVSLIASMLRGIEEVIGYYMRNKMSKAVAVLILQDDYQKSLSESLEEIKSNGQLLLKEAQKSNFWQNRKAWETTEQNSAKLDQVLELQQQIADMQNSFKGLLEQLEHNRKLPAPQFTAYLSAQVNYNHHSISYRGTTPSPVYTPSHSPSLLPAGILSPPPPPPPTITQADLQALFNSQEPIDLQDMQTILTSQSRIVSSATVNLDRILTSQKFNTWLVSPRSTELLIHGAAPATQYASILSLFCTTFLQTLRQSQNISLIFFCGLRLDSQQDLHTGGRGILLSFISQLLSQFNDFDLETVQIDIDIDALFQEQDPPDIYTLLDLFASLTKQVLSRGEETIFCLIDGIRYYEREDYAHEMGIVVKEILDLVSDQNGGREEEGLGILKVLITSPAPTTIVRHAFGEDEILTVGMTEQGEEGGGGGRFNADRVGRLLLRDSSEEGI
ncbi:hypothetical protein QBC44DRAFT_403905 [Cladorrhinum sp. PSN332]|nr:hypothetical protein QBC44DRAFT_403905 [Cladorrhinum sp. PSN332]